MKKRIPLPFVLVLAIFMVGCTCFVKQAPVAAPAKDKPPVIESFDANPPSISAGGTSTLSWKVSGATSVTIDQGIGNVAVVIGSRAVAPSTTTTYTLTATNTTGSTTSTTQVIVTGTPSTPSTPPVTPAGLPVINYFTASPPSIIAGSSTTLSWNVSNATAVVIDPGVGSVAMSGSLSVSPSVTTVYSLTATNALGSVNASTQVIVSTAPSPVTFAVTKVQAKGASASGTRPCPFTINYTFDITTNGAGTVSYHFERSDGATSPTYTLNFTSAGTKTVSHSWTVPASGTYSVRCRTLTPNDMSGNSVPVTVTCE